jgi:hypothetical protein
MKTAGNYVTQLISQLAVADSAINLMIHDESVPLGINKCPEQRCQPNGS